MSQTNFGVLLRGNRVAAGLSQEALAERAGVSAQAISMLENGKRRAPYRDTVSRLARALDLTAIETTALETAVVRRRRPVHHTQTPPPVSSQHEPGAVGFDFPSQDSIPNNLPWQLSSFVGHEREITQLTGLLSSTKLLTLTGGGMW